MSKNLFPEVAEFIGVEIGEKFKIKPEDNKYINAEEVYIDLQGVHKITDGCDFIADPCILYRLLKGEYKIELKPFQPKDGELYFTYDNDWNIITKRWDGDCFDYVSLKTGICYRSFESAGNMLQEAYRELTGGKLHSDE